jgi:predicted amidophosphoribosyltransferase
MSSSLRKAWGFLAVHLLPARCFVCGESLPALQHLGSCAPCWTRLAPLRAPACRFCALPLPGEGERCARCALRPFPLDALTAAFVYDEVARRFLLRAKSAGRRELLIPFGRQLAAAVRSSGMARGIDVVVAVPSSPLARLRRGFDPAATIAKELAAELRIPFDRAALARRVRPGGPAKSLGASARRAAVSRAFVARSTAARTVLLVDDVLTTGATASACAGALRGAGATTVRAAVWARTL